MLFAHEGEGKRVARHPIGDALNAIRGRREQQRYVHCAAPSEENESFIPRMRPRALEGHSRWWTNTGSVMKEEKVFQPQCFVSPLLLFSRKRGKAEGRELL